MLDLYRLHVTFCIDPDWKLQKVKGISPVLKLSSQNTFCTYTELNLYLLLRLLTVTFCIGRELQFTVLKLYLYRIKSVFSNWAFSSFYSA